MDEAAEDLDVRLVAFLHAGREIRERDVSSDREPEGGAPDPAGDLAAHADRLAAVELEVLAVAHHERAQPLARAGGASGGERIRADEALVLRDAEAEPGLVRACRPP